MKCTKLSRASAGFTMVELLVVIAVIAITAGVAIPSIAAYLRTYSIRKAAREVKAEIQAARTKAIMKNANHGVVFLVGPPRDYAGEGPNSPATNEYRIVIEDDVTCNRPSPVRRTISDLITTPSACAAAGTNPQIGTLRSLPNGIQFVAPSTANDSGMRFDRLGQWNDPGTDTAGGEDGYPLGTGLQLVGNTPGAGSVLTLREQNTGLERSIQVSPGGRVLICFDENCQSPES